jgi:hypothetical protein
VRRNRKCRELASIYLAIVVTAAVNPLLACNDEEPIPESRTNGVGDDSGAPGTGDLCVRRDVRAVAALEPIAQSSVDQDASDDSALTISGNATFRATTSGVDLTLLFTGCVGPKPYLDIRPRYQIGRRSHLRGSYQ